MVLQWRHTLRASGSSLRADAVRTGGFNAEIPACRNLADQNLPSPELLYTGFTESNRHGGCCWYLPVGELLALTAG